MVDLPAVNTPQFDWALNKMGRKAKPVAPIFEPEVPARAIFFAATHKRRDVWVGWPTVKAILANRIAPGLIDRYLAKAGYSGQLADQPTAPDAPANLFEPVPGDYAAHGRFDDQSRDAQLGDVHRSPQGGGSGAGGSRRLVWRRISSPSVLTSETLPLRGLRRPPDRGSPMSQNVAEFVWKRLNEWGLSRVYGYPGDGVGGLDVALEKAKDFMDYVQVRHEEMAAFMASAHAKFTGQPGLCYATSGPGAIHLLTGLYDAKADHMPVVAIVGQQARSALGASYQQEVDLQNAVLRRHANM